MPVPPDQLRYLFVISLRGRHADASPPEAVWQGFMEQHALHAPEQPARRVRLSDIAAIPGLIRAFIGPDGPAAGAA